MASTLMTNVSEGFDLQKLADDLSETYQAKGFTVRTMKMKKGLKLRFEKKCGGINMILGMGLGITATVTRQGEDTLVVNYSEGDWTGKIIGCLCGLLCLITAVTAIIGIVKQSSLPNDINNDIMTLIEE